MTPATRSLNYGNSEARQENFIAVIAITTLLIFVLVYCCWRSSCCQKFCSGLICQRDVEESEDGRNININQPTSSPTVIVLPHGRILIVDGTVFARFNAHNTGLDLFELGNRILRDERSQMNRSRSLNELDSGGNAKGSSTASYLPPTYESIFGDYHLTAPPSYSESFRNKIAENSFNGGG